MSNIPVQEEGILPTIQLLRDSFDELKTSMDNLFSGEITAESIQQFREKVNVINKRMEDLPDTVNRSYELIQLVIKSIHSSRSELKKSVDGLLKKTGMQLQKVTSTTEEATNKILDVAEKLDEEQMNIIGLLEKIENPETVDQGEYPKTIDELKTKIYANQDAAFTIMDYLQFQDITAQQIAGAYSLLSDTEKTLIYVSDLLKRFDSDRDKIEGYSSDIDKRSFNADAAFVDKATVQEAIDNLFASGNTDFEIPEVTQETKATPSAGSVTPDGETVNNDDIDSLFASKSSSKDGESMGADDIDALFSGGGAQESPSTGDSVSNDDIDALFAGGGDKKESKVDTVSNDDIDALFNSAGTKTTKDEEEKED